MHNIKKKSFLYLLFSTVLLLAACGGGGDIVLENQSGEEVSVFSNERPVVFFHFTGVD